MTIPEMAQFLGISKTWAWILIRDQKIEAEKRGRDWWVDDESVERYANTHLGKTGRKPKETK